MMSMERIAISMALLKQNLHRMSEIIRKIWKQKRAVKGIQIAVESSLSGAWLYTFYPGYESGFFATMGAFASSSYRDAIIMKMIG